MNVAGKNMNNNDESLKGSESSISLTSGQSFYCDDKFEVVLQELNSRGWKREVNYTSSCNLIWTNLRNVNWDDISANPNPDHKQIVNHLHGSQHLSNKSFLAYHLHASDKSECMPIQWSAAYQDLTELLGIVLVTTLFGCCTSLCNSNSNGHSNDSVTYKTQMSIIEECKKVYRVLIMDEDWNGNGSSSSSVCRNTVELLLAGLSTINKGETTEKIHEKLSIAIDFATTNMYCSPSYGDWNTWIIKPVGSGRGENITLARGIIELCGAVANLEHKCVVQKYIERPLLVRNNRKFDIRQWVLVSSVDPLVIYGYSEFYCRLAGKPFNLDIGSLNNAIVHLCNYTIQKSTTDSSAAEDDNNNNNNGKYEDIAETEGEGDYCEHMMDMRQLEEDIQNRKPNDANIIQTILCPQIKNLAVDAIRCVRDKMNKISSGFEWLGFDFIVTDSLEVKILECNVSPDISATTPITARLVKEGVTDLFALLLDEDNDSSLHDGHDGEQRQRKWELWHDGRNLETKENCSVLQFARKKREFAILKKDYSPEKKHVLDRVLSTLTFNEEDNSEDEM